MRFSVRCLSLLVAFFCSIGQAYIFIDQSGSEMVVLIATEKQVLYQLCGTKEFAYSQKEKSPDEVIKACSTVGKTFAAVRGEFLRSVYAVYGVPTALFKQTPPEDILSASAFAAENNYREDESAQSSSTSMAVKAAHREVVRFLGGQHHRDLNDGIPEESAVARAAMVSFHPIFSNGNVALHLKTGVEMKAEALDEACHPYWAVASLSNLLALGPATLASLADWIRERANTSDLGSFHYSLKEKSATSARFPSQVIQGVSKLETLVKISLNKEFFDLGAQSPAISGQEPTQYAGWGKVILWATPGMKLPVLCLRRFQNLNRTYKPEPAQAGGTSLGELAEQAGVTKGRFKRLAGNDERMESLLSSVYFSGQIGQESQQQLRQLSVELFRNGAVDFDKAVKEDQTAAAEDKRRQQQIAYEAQQAVARAAQEEANRQAAIRAQTVPFSVKNNKNFGITMKGSYTDTNGIGRTFNFRVGPGQTAFVGNARYGTAANVSATSNESDIGFYYIDPISVSMNDNRGVTQGMGTSSDGDGGSRRRKR